MPAQTACRARGKCARRTTHAKHAPCVARARTCCGAVVLACVRWRVCCAIWYAVCSVQVMSRVRVLSVRATKGMRTTCRAGNLCKVRACGCAAHVVTSHALAAHVAQKSMFRFSAQRAHVKIMCAHACTRCAVVLPYLLRCAQRMHCFRNARCNARNYSRCYYGERKQIRGRAAIG